MGEEIQENNVSHEETEFASNYEEERSRVDFDTVVKEAMRRNRGASEKTGVDALEREEGEDRPNIAALLAWAKATKDPNQTRTFVVRKRGVEEDTPPPQRQHSFNVSDDFEVIIQEKEKPVTQTAENGVTKISTSKKTFEVSQRASTFEVPKKSVIQSSENVTKSWFLTALIKHEQSNNCNIIKLDLSKNQMGDQHAIIEAEVDGDIKTYSWIVKETPKISDSSLDKDTLVIADLGVKFGRFASMATSKVPLSVPFPQVIFSDAQYTIIPDVSSYKLHEKNTPLDESHMKVGVRALARLHALSYAFFNSSSDNVKDFSGTLRVLVDHSFQPSATAEDREAAKLGLEDVFDQLMKVLEQNGAEAGLVDKSKTLRSMLYNIYKEARKSSSAFSVLCHGQPTLENIMFLYDASGVPVDAKFVNFTNTRIASSMSDVLVFLNSAEANVSRGDYFLRFVYYETLVRSLKQLGVRNDIVEFDSLKLEKGKQTLYGLIETASLILATTDSARPVQRKGPSVSSPAKSMQTRRVQSKILGDFIPKDAPKLATTDDSLTEVERSSGSEDGRRIVEIFERATEANSTRKTQRF